MEMRIGVSYKFTNFNTKIYAFRIFMLYKYYQYTSSQPDFIVFAMQDYVYIHSFSRTRSALKVCMFQLACALTLNLLLYQLSNRKYNVHLCLTDAYLIHRLNILVLFTTVCLRLQNF